MNKLVLVIVALVIANIVFINLLFSKQQHESTNTHDEQLNTQKRTANTQQVQPQNSQCQTQTPSSRPKLWPSNNEQLRVTIMTTAPPTIQTRHKLAIKSWAAQLTPTPHIIIGTNPVISADFEAFIREVGATRVNISRWTNNDPVKGYPMLDALFEDAFPHIKTQIVAYANADIIFLPSVVGAIALMRHFAFQADFMLVARRWNLNFNNGESLDVTNADQMKQLELYANRFAVADIDSAIGMYTN